MIGNERDINGACQEKKNQGYSKSVAGFSGFRGGGEICVIKLSEPAREMMGNERNVCGACQEKENQGYSKSVAGFSGFRGGGGICVIKLSEPAREMMGNERNVCGACKNEPEKSKVMLSGWGACSIDLTGLINLIRPIGLIFRAACAGRELAL